MKPTPQPQSAVRVTAPARLHMGFIDLNGELGRMYGSIGLAIEQPSTTLTVSQAPQSSAEGLEANRALSAICEFRSAFDLDQHFAVDVHTAIPAHAGLGSGTQLALAVGAGITKLSGRKASAQTLGEVLARGARSAIGMAAFEGGGFIIDGGRAKSSSSPPVLMRHDFPDDWRVVLAMDNRDTGVHGDKELTAFSNLPPLPESACGHISRVVLMRLMPGLIEKDIDEFGAAITEIQEIVGGHFAAAQGGGIWSSKEVAHIVSRMAEAGAVGIGQSSWGPTGFAFVSSQSAADRLYHSLAREAKRDGVELLVVRGRNTGASIDTQHHPAKAGLEIRED